MKMVVARSEEDTVALGCESLAFVSKQQSPLGIESYLVEHCLDQGYNSDQDLAGEVAPAVDNLHHKHIGAGFGDHTGAVMVGTSKLPVKIHNPSVL